MSEGKDHFFSESQRRTVTAAITFLSVLLIVGLSLVVFLILQRLVSFFSGVIWPLVIAGVLALLLRPLVLFLERVPRLSRIKSILLLYLFAVLLCAAFLALVLPAAISQTIEFIRFVPSLADNALEFFKTRFPDLLDKVNEETVKTHLQPLLEGVKQMALLSFPAIREAGQWLLNLFAAAAASAIIPIYLFYFLTSDRDLTRDLDSQLAFIHEGIRADMIFLIREFAGIMVAFFRGQLLIGILMGILLAVGFTLAGLNFGLVLGLVMGLLNIVPYLGTILGFAVALPIAFFQPDGGWLRVGFVLIVFVLVQIVEGYFLTPKIMGKQTGLHPLVIIIAIFFWGTALNGLLGMILAIPLTAFFIIAWRLVERKYLIGQVVGEPGKPPLQSPLTG